MLVSAGLSPVWQQVLLLDAFAVGQVNRVRQVHWCASGKVLNAARALHHLGGPCKAVTVVGGTTGALVRHDFAQLGIAARWLEATTPTRVCTTLLDSAGHTATELVPNAGPISDAERQAFLDAYAEEAAAAVAVVLIGSLPAGAPASLYRDLLERTPGKAILDARGPELLEALRSSPFLIKPNRQELGQTLDRELRGDADLFDAMREMNERGAEWVVVTDGSGPVHARSRHQLYRLRPPPGEVVNPIGCGDSMAAGIAWSLGRGREPLDALRYGVAAAADKVGRLLPGMVQRERVEALAGSVAVARM